MEKPFKEKKKTPKHFPSSIREWNNSIYLYNNRNLNLIPNTMILSINIVKTYFSLYNKNLERKMRTKRLIHKIKKLSSSKIYISNGEFKHTNNKVIINLFVFNRQKYNYIFAVRRLTSKIFFKRKNNKIYKTENKLLNNKNKLHINKAKDKFLKKNMSSLSNRVTNLSRKKRISIKAVFFKKTNKNYSKTFNLKVLNPNNDIKYNRNNKYKNLNASKNTKFSAFNKKKPIMLKNVYKLLNILITKVFSITIVPNKKMLYQLVFFKKLAFFYLFQKELILIKCKNSNDLSKYLNYFFKNLIKTFLKKHKLFFYYKQLIYINKTKYKYDYLQHLNKYLYKLYNKNIEFNIINLKRMYLHSDILSESIKLKITRKKNRMIRNLKRLEKKIKTRNYKNVKKLEISNYKLDFKKSFLEKDFKKPFLKKDIIRKLMYKKITGFRLELKGRLTRRYTASRSKWIKKHEGGLENMFSSVAGKSTVLLKGNLKSNLQHTKLKSKSNIGSFGIKGWVSGS